MKRFLLMLTVIATTLETRVGAGEAQDVYYVQLIRCSDNDAPPEPGSHKIGPKLAERFQCVFRCKSYWEIGQEKMSILPKHTAVAHLSNGRDVEIDLSEPGKRKVSTFYHGKLLDRTVEPASENMTLIGGDRDPSSHWFIVVRRDKPGP